MNPHFSLTQVQTVKLSITPQLKQSIHILQLSSADLVDYLQEQAAGNPMLDLNWHSLKLKKKQKQGASSYSNYSPDEWLNNRGGPEETLEMMLTLQLDWLEIPEKQKEMAKYLAGNLNDDGYLMVDVDDVSMTLQVGREDVERGLSCLQALEPAGVGARGLKECLQLQISRDSAAAPWAQRIVSDCLPELGANKFKRIAEKLKISMDEVRHAISYVRTLNPRPGLPYNHTAQSYIVPDAVIHKQHGDYKIIMNEQTFPQLSINPYYKQLAAESDNEQTKDFLRSHVQPAKWLIRSLKDRQNTLFKVIDAIVQEQAAFFEKGIAHLQQLNLKTIALQLGLHESTVSRAVQHKYVQTPHGFFELSFFFTSGLLTDKGGAASAESVKARIKVLIDQEDKRSPLSDQKLTDILTNEGIQISRRTVMKYREDMYVLSSRLRSSG
ncbi:RNA polymerase factor sigma-54 [Paenibacillus eucommiae]|uniref:RNA polymerase sigma-54 factor n=1 Tax=Paenibacillus eucommiae TaxID=1355755 RepID=A0ABS4J9Z7_9BACL|nr:RNA polymerase factor sigma-54 [Paenibacillus eucommiae]MBP1995906.1 RNA polymerase sigma-54 factor [Paenibacillus eucommiae]